MALKLTLKGSFVQILVLDNELWLDIPSLSPQPCCLEVRGDAQPSSFLMWKDFSENILLLFGSTPEFSEAHRWLKPHAAVNHYTEHFLRNLENRKANTLSASNQKPILSEKPAPCPCLPQHALSQKSSWQFICSGRPTTDGLPVFPISWCLKAPFKCFQTTRAPLHRLPLTQCGVGVVSNITNDQNHSHLLHVVDRQCIKAMLLLPP